ncbi:MAG: DEAD/DEAH box helicase [Acidimicrobiales bacterium]
MTTAPLRSLPERLPVGGSPDAVLEAFLDWVADVGLTLYPAQEEALLEVVGGANVIVATPTGSGKSMVAVGAHFAALATGRRSFYTAPIKALVSEKFFDLCRIFGADRVGMMTGDSSINAQAPIVCATAEILANIALRQGRDAPVGLVVADEFHFYADPDRGWAWQVPLLELTGAQHVLMSATLGDVRRFETDLTQRTGRPTVTITSATRPVPLHYSYRNTPLHRTIDDVLAAGGAPVYVVSFTQASAVELAQALMSTNVATREEKADLAEAIGEFRFEAGFGRVLSRFLRHGVGVHHAGMLPKYRRLVEKLTQDGLLKVICGTDTLGVGINVPIRTVVFTALSKYDGTATRLLSAREFHQIAGRAGRAGYDTEGNVVAQAPEHVIDNELALAKAGEDPKKRRKVVRSQPPKGFVGWSEETFERLIASPPERLGSSFGVSHSMLLNVLDRPGDGCGALRRLLTDNHEARPAQRRHIRRAISIYRSLTGAGVVERLAEPDELGRTTRVTVDLQADFALNQPLSPFVLEALGHLDRDSTTYPFEVLSVVEATLENPNTVLAAQLSKIKTDAINRLKAEGVEYEQRMEALDQLEYPKPLAEFLYGTFDAYRVVHPWAADHNIRPKSVVLDMLERAMGFTDYVAFYGLNRSEGLVLRYLTDAYKALVQSVPEEAKTEELEDITSWLGETVRQTDSSLLDEWESLRHPEDIPPEKPALPSAPPRLTANPRALRVMVRNEAFRRVALAARRDWDGLASLDAGTRWDGARWREAFEDYFAVHDRIHDGPGARSPDLFQVSEGSESWTVRQVLDDPDGDHDWALAGRVDLAASDEAGQAVWEPLGVELL